MAVSNNSDKYPKHFCFANDAKDYVHGPKKINFSTLNLHYGILFILAFYFSVERGIVELRKLGIEHQIWEASRRQIDQNFATDNGQGLS